MFQADVRGLLPEMAKKNRQEKQDEIQKPIKKYPRYFYLLLILLVLAGTEGLGRLIYQFSFDEEQDLMYRAFLGLGGGYDPNMVSNYIPHHYLIYVLNPKAMYYHLDYFGKNPVHFINSLGFRGKEFSKEKPEGTYRIICVGGSTTFSFMELDESKTYPQMLENELNRRFAVPKFEVINAGTPGWSTAESLINLQFRLLELSPDMIVVYHGVNDTFAMRSDEEGKSDYSNFRQIIDYKPPKPFEQKIAKYSTLYRLYYFHTHTVARDINRLAVRPRPRSTDEEKNINEATGKYFRQNMEGIVNIAKGNGIVPVLMTMGHGLWHPSLPRVNQITRVVAQKKETLLVDFELLSRPQYFASDNVHCLRSGNEARVSAIADVLSKANLGFQPKSD